MLQHNHHQHSGPGASLAGALHLEASGQRDAFMRSGAAPERAKALTLTGQPSHARPDEMPLASVDVPGICGRLACVLLPLLAWFCLQPIESLRLTGAAWAGGNWHTLWTGHLMHYGSEHFIWDALMFVSFALLLWKEERWRLWLWLLIAAPIISLAVFAVHPALTEYRGLSALDTMLFVRYFLGGLLTLRAWQRWCFAVLPLLALAAKIIFEFVAGGSWFVGDMGMGVVPLPAAHLAGALLGILWFGSVGRLLQLSSPDTPRRCQATQQKQCGYDTSSP